MNEHIAVCAHLKISYRTKDNGDGTVSGWWECDNDCEMKFAPNLFVAHIVTCDLCDEPAEYRQCQGCMNDKLVGSHTDEEWDKLKSEIDQLKGNIKKLVQLKLMTEAERQYYYKELVNLVY